MITTINDADFFNWIQEQKDEAPLNFFESINKKTVCGCPMVQYGRAKGWEFTHCGVYSWYAIQAGQDTFRLTKSVFSMLDLDNKSANAIKTFGQLKHHIANIQKKEVAKVEKLS